MVTPRVSRVLGALAVLAAVLLPGTAAAQVPAQLFAAERIDRLDVDVEVARDGRLHVVETIDYVFTSPRHGILRRIPERDEERDGASWRLRVSGVRVRAAEGTPADTKVTTDGAYRVIRIGDPDVKITGMHRYVLSYTVEGALTRTGQHDELRWDAVGDEWAVPVAAVAVRVRAADGIRTAGCAAGPYGSGKPCGGRVRVTGGEATFAHRGLGPREAVTVRVALPRGYAARVGPYEPPPPVATDAATAGVAAGTLLVGLGGVALILRRGRDLRWTGQVPGLEPRPGADARAVPASPFADRAGPVEWLPPEGMPPAIAGVLLDQRFEPRHLGVTVADLAVRGHLRMERITGIDGDPEWRLHALDSPDELAPFERHLLGAIFDGAETTTLRSVSSRLGYDVDGIRQRVWDDVTARRWFRARPDRVRARWFRIGATALLAAVVAAVVVARTTPYDLVGLALVPPPLLLFALRRRMPVRTATGSAALARVLGFRRYLETAEAEQIRAEDRAGEFSRYLPWAIVFGVQSRWADVLSGLGLSTADVPWAPAGASFAEVASAASTFGYGATSSSSGSGSTSSFTSTTDSGGTTAGSGAGGGGGSSW